MRFISRFLLLPFTGFLTPRYIIFLLRDRLLYAFRRRDDRAEAVVVVMVHVAILLLCLKNGLAFDLLFFWWMPFFVVYPIIGWFSELSEHYPMMGNRNGGVFYSKNRYAGWLERFLIGMHGDNYHLTHHLVPGVPHWNLGKATEILREDSAFRAWDDTWGGIFSTQGSERVSFVAYVLNDCEFEPSKFHASSARSREC